MVNTSVGLRCTDCARGQPPVMYQTDASILGRALGVGLGAALVLGVLWGLLNEAIIGQSGLTWDFWFCLLIGFGIAESVSLAAKRRRGSNLQLLSIGLVLLSFAVSRIVMILRATQLLDGAILSGILTETIAQPTLLIFLALACLIVWRRFR